MLPWFVVGLPLQSKELQARCGNAGSNPARPFKLYCTSCCSVKLGRARPPAANPQRMPAFAITAPLAAFRALSIYLLLVRMR
jgi:hypothetical protein